MKNKPYFWCFLAPTGVRTIASRSLFVSFRIRRKWGGGDGEGAPPPTSGNCANIFGGGKRFVYKTVTPKSHTAQRMKEPSFLSDFRSGVKSTHTAQRKKKSLLQHVTNNHTGELWAEEKTDCTCGVSATVATPRNTGMGKDFPACMYMPLHACTCMHMHVHVCTCMYVYVHART